MINASSRRLVQGSTCRKTAGAFFMVNEMLVSHMPLGLCEEALIINYCIGLP